MANRLQRPTSTRLTTAARQTTRLPANPLLLRQPRLRPKPTSALRTALPNRRPLHHQPRSDTRAGGSRSRRRAAARSLHEWITSPPLGGSRLRRRRRAPPQEATMPNLAARLRALGQPITATSLDNHR